MPRLRRHRRDHRARAPKRRKRRNLVKFIPEADSDFAFTAGNFASRLKRLPDAYGLSADDIDRIGKVVSKYRETLAELGRARISGSQSPQLISRKDAARYSAETTVRMYANIIRADPRVTPTNKKLLRLKDQPAKLGKRKCPKAPPTLLFLGSGDGATGGLAEGSGSGVHVLEFVDASNGGLTIRSSDTKATVRRAKPDGAVRVELFFDMIPAGEGGGLPRLPNERGWPKYLRSFTRSPMEVVFPVPSEPMLLVYWARWADSTGEVSRWSKPCVARVEGWSAEAQLKAALPQGQRAMTSAKRVETKYVYIQTPIAGELPEAGVLEGDELAAALTGDQRALEAANVRMLEAA